ncbi:MAG: ribonuclease E/G [Alphaproteobacteria bacterium]|nr:ribonuclease E/G [Alphaproteobacteria bacterium]
MLIDATHAEETRVAVIDGNRLVEFDYESKYRKPLKGSIFLAKVTRVEPSLQAAFVNFGGNRHGFLPFAEIHPDYFRIPISDREALIAEQEELMREQEEEYDEEHAREEAASESASEAHEDDEEEDHDLDEIEEIGGEVSPADAEETAADAEESHAAEESDEDDADDNIGNTAESDEDRQSGDRGRRGRRGGRGRNRGRGRGGRAAHRSRQVEVLGGTEYDDEGQSNTDRARFALRRKYKIQEVIKRGQIMLIQVSREERGNKGAAVSTYLSLPGRYGVLMPNSPRAGGVSRKIASFQDRARLRDMLKEFEVPKGMSVILRTAGVSRTKPEIKRDLDYLMRLWDDIRELTLKSSAPAMIYEEADLMKRAVRDLYGRDIEDLIVAGEEGQKTAKKFMKMMMPSHVAKVKLYKDDGVPLFHKYGVENQISDIGEPTARLKSGGYLVINPTEALVSIDVNSGRATKERHIEETALNTNLEAAEEVARQLRLRDLGGLVVIDFIDMEDRRNNARVERKLKEALSGDRARIQIGRISSFGLLELSRQRLNPSLTESQFHLCDHCNGRGHVRTPDATTIMLLRAIEEEGIKRKGVELLVHVSDKAAIYLLNYKRAHLDEIESKYDLKVMIRVDSEMGSDRFRIEVLRNSADQDDDERDDDEDNGGNNRGERERNGNNNRHERSEEGRDGDRNGRRRGRRGGRNRRGDRSRSEHRDDDHGDVSEESFDDTSEEVQAQDMEEKADQPKKGRGAASRSAKKVSDDVSDAEEKVDKKPAAKKPAAKGKKADEVADDAKPARKSAAKAKVAKDEAVAEEDAKPAKKTAAKKPAAKKAVKASNDTAPKEEKSAKKEPPAPPAYEVVEEAAAEGGNKKRGWWNRLVE